MKAEYIPIVVAPNIVITLSYEEGVKLNRTLYLMAAGCRGLRDLHEALDRLALPLDKGVFSK